MSSLIPLSVVAAVVPAIVYVVAVWWSDRYEREPGWLLTTAFLWGAIPAILLSVAGAVLLQGPQAVFDTGLRNSLFHGALVAPVVEEIAKGLALVGIAVFFAREIDSTLDGIIYGALVGIGFGMTENFLYFLQVAIEQNGANWPVVAFLRTVVFGLNHAFYSAILGAVLGYALTTRPTTGGRWLLALFGLAAAIVVHGLHNLVSLLTPFAPALLLFDVLLSWGGVIVLVVIIVAAWRKEKGWIRTYLADEVPAVLSEDGYRFAQGAAQRCGGWVALAGGRDRRCARIQHEFQHAATELAFYKHRLEGIGADSGAVDETARLRQRLARLDAALIETLA
ncbi:MAG: PrsW family intramembrane metalloprotease [Caldilineales bacterium]|nr:PrsW family intramembrane metalloprotease [Caldilineales bacterium]MCW5857209.1 PrsW family intramembrane metalloprotease [Caldilineales bacterium]